jgi:hypothetical protein
MIEFTIDPILVITLVVGTVLPLLVGLVTTRVTHSGVKALLLAGLSLATALLTELGASWTRGEAYDLGTGLLLALPTFLVAVGLHYGIWKPVGASAAVQSVGTHAKD